MGYSDKNKIEGNALRGNKVSVRVGGSYNVIDNNITSNCDDGVLLTCRLLSIPGVVIHPHLICCGLMENSLIVNNRILNNHNGVFVRGRVKSTTVRFNKIVGISEYGIFNESENIVCAENNWWGDPSGPSGEGPGSGDEVSENVDYDPWLKSSQFSEPSNGGGPSGLPLAWIGVVVGVLAAMIAGVLWWRYF